MKKLIGILAPLLVALPLSAAILIGDPYQKVIQEKGAPSGKIEGGGTQILRYPDQTIKLKDGRVVSVDTPAGRPAAPNVPAAPEAPPPNVGEPAPASARNAGPVGPATWTTNYAAALVQAKEQNRRVFLFFTGSDWCGWCIRLKKEILSTPEFARYAQEKLILVEVDFPQRVRQSADLKQQNAGLARSYRIQGYPSVVILNPSGRPVGELGYQEGGPAPFIQALSRM